VTVAEDLAVIEPSDKGDGVEFGAHAEVAPTTMPVQALEPTGVGDQPIRVTSTFVPKVWGVARRPVAGRPLGSAPLAVGATG
jgi:hypothetical protein